MKAKRGLVYSILCMVLLGSVFGVSQPADAASGSVSIAPGETKYVSFGTCAVGDVLLWDLEISTLSTIFVYWLQTPSGAHVSLYSLTWGKVVDAAGEWKLGFSIDESGWWSATVYYAIYRTTPKIEIATPKDSSYVNQPTITISGTVDSLAGSVAISLDSVHYEQADLYLGTWTKQVTLPNDGAHTLYAEGTLVWGSYTVKYRDSVSITLDTVLPELMITTPTNNSYVRDRFNIEWQCSDDNGIALEEVRIDLNSWITIEYGNIDCPVTEGSHVAYVRVTDVAGNLASASLNFISDLTPPTIVLTDPTVDSKISTDSVTVSWSGSDGSSGIDHYEILISGGDWVDVGLANTYTFTGLEDKWYSITVRAIDVSGNEEESSVSFGIYTSVWSTNGPYQGIPLFVLIAAVIIAAALSVVLYRKKKGATATTDEPEGVAEGPHEEDGKEGV